jgi:hypothetical protein
MTRRIYTGTDPALIAKDYDAQADADYRRARRAARDTAEWYRHAAHERDMLAWTLRRIARGSEMGDLDTPATIEESIRLWTRLADRELQRSFRLTDDARRHAAAARRFRAIAAQSLAS